MAMIPAKCTNCGANIQVDETKEAGICEACGTAFITEKVINNYNTTNNYHADVVNVFKAQGEDFEITGGTLVKYKGSATEVVVPAGVKCIGANTFKDYKYITSVVLPEGLEEIGYGAFDHCERLQEVKLPTTLKKIGTWSFGVCTSLHSIDIPASVTEIGDYAFAFCTILRNVSIPKGLRKIGENAFDYCKNLSRISIPILCDVDKDAFKGCENLRIERIDIRSKEEIERAKRKEEARKKDDILSKGKAKMGYNDIYGYEEAIRLFKMIPGWKDANEQVRICQTKIQELKESKRKMQIVGAIIAVIIAAIIAFLVVLFTVIIPDRKYNEAVALMNSDVIQAYEALISLDGYKDSAEKANSIFEEYKAQKLKVADVGDYIYFGAYEQDNNTTNGKEDIEWLVLDKEDNKILVVSKYLLDCQQYHTHTSEGAYNIKITWEMCSLRAWLNDTFINSAFSSDEQAMIPITTVSADKNPGNDLYPGEVTQDKVFLLSVTEANKYFSSDKSRECKRADYATEQESFSCPWWLRTVGDYITDVSVVDAGGEVQTGAFSEDADEEYVMVRPAMWIDIS